MKPDKTKNSEKPERSDKEFVDFFRKHHQDVKNKDMSKIERAPLNRRRNILIFVFSILILILAATLFGFNTFTKENKFTGEGIDIKINIPDRISSGNEVSLDFLISNNEPIDLKSSQLAVRFPDGFRFSTAQPAPSNEFNNAWDLGTLKSGSETRIIIRGQLVGEVDSTKVFQATLSYIPSNFNSEFQKTVTKNVTITSSIIELKVTSPDGAVDEQEIQFKVAYKNTSVKSLENVRLKLTYPDGFTYQSAEPEPRTGNNDIWQNDILAEKEEKTVTINGTISGEPGSMKEIKAEIGLIKQDGTFSLQTESYTLLTILEPASDLELTINNDYKDSVINWGDNLTCQIKFKNKGEIVLNDIELNLTWEQNPKIVLDNTTLVDSSQGIVSENGIKWTSAQIKELASVGPDEEIKIDFQIKVKPYADLVIEESDVNFSLASQVKATSPNLKDTGGSYLQQSNRIINQVATQVDFNAEGRYYDDEFDTVGSGALPPAVGQTTTYRVYWYIANTTNSLSDLVITTTLPEKAEWAGNNVVSPSGTLTYDPEQRTVVWSISELPAHLGRFLPEARASFDVAITPESDDVGNLMVITESTQMEAIDSLTKAKISATSSPIDSSLENDLAASGKGVVIEASPEANVNLNINQSINSDLNQNINS